MELRLLNKEELAVLAAKSYKKITPYSSHGIKHLIPNCFRCNHCSHDVFGIPERRRTGKQKGGLLTLKEVIKHLQDK